MLTHESAAQAGDSEAQARSAPRSSLSRSCATIASLRCHSSLGQAGVVRLLVGLRERPLGVVGAGDPVLARGGGGEPHQVSAPCSGVSMKRLRKVL